MTNQLPEFESELLKRIHQAKTNTSKGPELAVLLNNLAVVYHTAGKFQEADSLHKQCIAMLDAAFGSQDRRVAQSLANRASLYRTFQEFAEAERIFQLAVRLWDEQGWPSEGEMKTNIEDSPSASVGSEMLWADVIQRDRSLRLFGREVRSLRESSEEILGAVLAKMGPWYHDVKLRPGLSTNPIHAEYMANRWKFLAPFIPEDLHGKSVLDIGCNSGFFSFQMRKRNAGRILGIDIMPHLLAQARFLSHWLEQPLELKEMGAYDVESLGPFDVVIFIGVLYHLKHPLYALEKVASICTDTLYIQSKLQGSEKDFEPADDYPFEEKKIFDRPEFPRMYFIEKSFNGDVSNWWYPNKSCLKAMIRTAGFRQVEDSLHPELMICRK